MSDLLRRTATYTFLLFTANPYLLSLSLSLTRFLAEKCSGANPSDTLGDREDTNVYVPTTSEYTVPTSKCSQLSTREAETLFSG